MVAPELTASTAFLLLILALIASVMPALVWFIYQFWRWMNE